jgi:hypothetical protein
MTLLGIMNLFLKEDGFFKEAVSSTFGPQSEGPTTSWFNVLQQPHELSFA